MTVQHGFGQSQLLVKADFALNKHSPGDLLNSLALLPEDMDKGLATIFLPLLCYIPHPYKKPCKEVLNCFLPVTRKASSFILHSQSKLRNKSNKRLYCTEGLGGGGKEVFFSLDFANTITNMK